MGKRVEAIEAEQARIAASGGPPPVPPPPPPPPPSQHDAYLLEMESSRSVPRLPCRPDEKSAYLVRAL